MRAEKPEMFIPWLDACTITSRSGQTMERELLFGETRIHDQVTFHPPMHVAYYVPAQEDIPVSSLNMRIETPQEGVLIVRFEYSDDSPDTEGTPEDMYNEFRRSAYQEADIDTVRMIRQLAADGRLDATEQ